MKVQTDEKLTGGVFRLKRTRMAFFCVRDDVKDLKEIYEFVKARFEVRVFEGSSDRQVFELMKWSDISWFEGIGNLTVTASHLLKACRMIVRLDENDVRGDLVAKIKWENVDVLIFDGQADGGPEIPGIGRGTRVVRIGQADLVEADRCSSNYPAPDGLGSTRARVYGLLLELARDPFHYDKETDFCRGRLAKYCQGRGVDVGCGDNKILPDAIGVDIEDRANEIVADARNLPFEDESMDYVYSSHCLEDLEDTAAALAEWMRVLRTGGNLALYLPHRNFYPRVGTPGANPAHKHDLNPNCVLAALSETNDYTILHIDEVDTGGEHSFSVVVRKERGELPGRRVLVEYHAALGDVMCIEPAVRALKQQLGSDAAITVRVTHPELFRNHPSVSRIENTLFPQRHQDYESRYELSYEPTEENRRLHLVDRAAKQIGVRLGERLPRIWLDRWDEVMLRKYYLPDSGGPRIAISSHVNWASRQWENSKWARLCTILEKRFNVNIIHLGGRGASFGGFGLNLIGQTSPREAAAVLSKCDLLIAVDTGLVHLAAAVGTPCVGLFGPTDPKLRMHPGPHRAVTARNAECRGCFHWYQGDMRICPKDHNDCMRLISVQSVVQAAYEILAEGRAGPPHRPASPDAGAGAKVPLGSVSVLESST